MEGPPLTEMFSWISSTLHPHIQLAIKIGYRNFAQGSTYIYISP